MQRWLSLVLLAVLAVQAGCAVFVSKERRYLKAAVGHATAADVREALGAPRRVTTTPSGEEHWLYEVHDVEPMSQNSWATLGSWCDQYRLIFDRTGVLRHWTHHAFLHGGELMPVSCDSGLGVEKPAW